MSAILSAKKISLNKNNIKSSPESPGIYIFWENGIPLYIGKSVNLKKRIESYFFKTLLKKTSLMMESADHFSVIPVNSELESLLLEAKLVNYFKPKFNSQLKDDKHPLYIVITNDYYPRVLTARKKDEHPEAYFFGPFPSSTKVKYILSILRKIFPYSHHKTGKRGCLYSQIGLCDPCPSVIENTMRASLKAKRRRAYLKNIFYVRLFLKGRINKIKRDLEKEMKLNSDKEFFEEAQEINNKINTIDYITQPITNTQLFVGNPNLIDDIRKLESLSLINIIRKITQKKINLVRVECFDVAHLGGSFPTASMDTFIKGEPEKNLYRHFRIRQKRGRDDISSIKEVAKRRKKYISKWGKPDLIIVDGGKAQLKTFSEVFEGVDIVILGLAKRFETLIALNKSEPRYNYKSYIVRKDPALYLLQRIRNEAHRFARRYHHYLIKRDLLK